MSITIKHPKVLSQADGTDNTVMRPSDFNANHELLMATAKLLGRGSADVGLVEEISLGTNLSLSGNTLNATGGDIINDTTPQLGGDLDQNGHLISGVSATEMACLIGIDSNIQNQLDPLNLMNTPVTVTSTPYDVLVANKGRLHNVTFTNGGTINFPTANLEIGDQFHFMLLNEQVCNFYFYAGQIYFANSISTTYTPTPSIRGLYSFIHMGGNYWYVAVSPNAFEVMQTGAGYVYADTVEAITSIMAPTIEALNTDGVIINSATKRWYIRVSDAGVITTSEIV